MMRTLSDRIRHTILFEVIALFIVVVVGSKITGEAPEKIGALGVMFSGLAMGWNLVFNWLFDLWDRKYRKAAPRGFYIRCVHVVLFEAALFVCGIFLVAWWLNVSLVYAFWLDIGMSAFFVCYAFFYNWGYDLVFPLPQQALQEE